MSSPTRADLQGAAREFFEELASELQQPRSFDVDHRDNEIDLNVEMSRTRIRELDDQLQEHKFDPVVRQRAQRLASHCGAEWVVLAEKEHFALQLAARAEREQMEMLIHGLRAPGKSFNAVDDIFAPASDVGHAADIPPTTRVREADQTRYPTLRMVVEDFTKRMHTLGLGRSQIDEVGRILRWLMEEIEPSTSMGQITTTQLRTFRNNVERMDSSRQGRASPFRQRLTDIPERQLASATAQKYWSGVQSVFAWAYAEGKAPSDPAALLKVTPKKGEVRRSPEPFSREELERLYLTPLFSGYQSPVRLMTPGDCHERGQHWWTGVLPLWTGLRAGELTQLLPSDFVFDHDVPHFLVQEVDGDGLRTKTTKNISSIRAVPLAPLLLDLGIRQFVERRAKIQPKARLFERLRLGTAGKISEGMARFWGDYLRVTGLHKPGRGTHVMRHTIIEFLRAADVADEDIAAVVGHSRRTQTSRYGRKDFPLLRKLGTIKKLDFGIDFLALLGGPYKDELHRS